MADLISRAAALDVINTWGRQKSEKVRMELLHRDLDAIPAVDAAPVVHGRWIDIPDKPEWDQKMCSVCGEYFCCQNNYCPNCGARMRGEADG